MRKTPTWYGNVYSGGTDYNNGSLMARDDRKMYLTNCPSAGLWFARFMRGAKLRMGVIRKQNEAFTVRLLLALSELAEGDWQSSSDEQEKRDIEEMMVFALASFCAALRGEEVPLIVLEGLRKFWDETKVAKPTPHVMLTLRGRFKGEQGLRWHCVPVVDVTASGLQVRLWFERLLTRRLVRESRVSGWLFARADGTRAKCGDYDLVLRDYIDRVRDAHPGLISANVSLEDFSFRRSGRRGAATEATNRNMDPKAIELINRWRKKENAKGTEPGLPMRQVYTQVSQSLPTLLRYSQCF